MKQIVLLSGKGGTGKTSVAAAFAHLAHVSASPLSAVLADADVDAANLGLVLHPKQEEAHDFTGGAIAVINYSECIDCGVCENVCRFDAILTPSMQNNGSGEHYSIDTIACDGCAACVYACPVDAIHMEPQQAGRWFRSTSRYGTLFHADLFPAQENSGKLVTLVKQQARLFAMDNDFEVVIVDGPPGIGCPVIAAASGATIAIIVTEPTITGVHDLNRTLETTYHFKIPTFVIINKADLNALALNDIVSMCSIKNIEIIGQIPFDQTITEAMRKGDPVTAYNSEARSSKALVTIWERVVEILSHTGDSE
ncbi:MAG TPA: P-loop NTPase [Anaerolineae bacterium]|nr:P-loop NTPase [Anaerolineae bacterium]